VAAADGSCRDDDTDDAGAAAAAAVVGLVTDVVFTTREPLTYGRLLAHLLRLRGAQQVHGLDNLMQSQLRCGSQYVLHAQQVDDVAGAVIALAAGAMCCCCCCMCVSSPGVAGYACVAGAASPAGGVRRTTTLDGSVCVSIPHCSVPLAVCGGGVSLFGSSMCVG
jgi:hypothetical protein